MRIPVHGLALATWLSAGLALAQEAQGFAELRGAAFPGVDGKAVQVVERLRPSFTTDVTERVALSATVEAALVQGRSTAKEVERVIEQSDFGPVFQAAGCTFPTHTNETLRVSRASDYLDVDRLFVDGYLPAADLRVGRQAVHWGSAQFFNPTDPFPEFLLTEPWRPRRGVNAGRVTVPFGEAHDATAIVATDDAFDSIGGAGRVKLNWLETDTALVGSYRSDSEAGFVGVDVRGTLGVGFWVEGGARIDSDPHEEIVAGVDYSFPLLERLVLMAQYYRNGAGATDPDDHGRPTALAIAPPRCDDPALQALLGGEEPDPFAPTTLARDYAMIGAMLAITLDLSLNLFWLQNLDDGTGMLVPTASYVIADWLDVSVSAQVPLTLWGDGGELDPRDEDLRLEQDVGGQVLRADFSGLVPATVVTLWTRASF